MWHLSLCGIDRYVPYVAFTDTGRYVGRQVGIDDLHGSCSAATYPLVQDTRVGTFIFACNVGGVGMEARI